MVEGHPPVDLEPGARLTLRIQFRANVLRGTYRVQLRIADAMRIWAEVDQQSLGLALHSSSRNDAGGGLCGTRACV